MLSINHQNSNISFCAVKSAVLASKTKRFNNKLEIYTLDKTDREISGKLIKNLDLYELYKNHPDYNWFEEWKGIIDDAASRIGFEKVFLAVHANKPCGILSFYKEENNIYISRLAAWQNKPKTNLHAGTALMQSLFKDIHGDFNGIFTWPALIKPLGKSCLDFYKKLYFKQHAVSQKLWYLSDKDMPKAQRMINTYFTYSRIDDKNRIDLTRILRF